MFDLLEREPEVAGCGDNLVLLPAGELLAVLLAEPPGAETGRLLATIDPASLSPADRIDLVSAWERQEAWTVSQKTRATAAVVAGCVDDTRFLPEQLAAAELSAALSVAPGTADCDVALAGELTGRLARLGALLEQGQLSMRHVRAIADEVGLCSPDTLDAVLDAVLPRVGALTPGRLRRLARRTVVRLDAAAVRERREREQARREVTVVELGDDMAELRWRSTVDEIYLGKHVLDRLAARPTGADDERTADQRRSDTMFGVLLKAFEDPELPELPGRRRLKADVTVSFETLVGAGQAPGELKAMGPIGAELVRRMAEDAALRFLVYGGDGRLLTYDPGTWRPSAALQRHTVAKADCCTFPSCSRPAEAAQHDHAIPFAEGGETAPDNQHGPCFFHHRLKTHGSWSVTLEPDGTAVWTSPAGKTYYVHPPDLRPDG